MSPLMPRDNRLSLDEAYLQMAEIWAQRSKANRSQVGALLVRGNQIISDGYNGMPAGSPDELCEIENSDGSLSTKDDVHHAEANALLKLARSGGQGASGGVMYVTLAPCVHCSKLMHQAGVRRVVYRNEYRDSSGVDYLRKYGVDVDFLPK